MAGKSVTERFLHAGHVAWCSGRLGGETSQSPESFVISLSSWPRVNTPLQLEVLCVVRVGKLHRDDDPIWLEVVLFQRCSFLSHGFSLPKEILQHFFKGLLLTGLTTVMGTCTIATMWAPGPGSSTKSSGMSSLAEPLVTDVARLTLAHAPGFTIHPKITAAMMAASATTSHISVQDASHGEEDTVDAALVGYGWPWPVVVDKRASG
ncbi:hypothetical protein HPB51_027950 [Rhipicephalus microplus]|uniref:Uncharacterized protein n=1 Tax=Rhipicephalus microplus TaxID=6941 RepID=A0A9J6CYN7_RHIMP|nr:hypothetical protein HPB51_027950 [Rhipicephalus microplus]